MFALCTTHYYWEAESHAQQWPPAPAGSPSRRPNDDIKRSITSTAILVNLHDNTLVQNSSDWPVLIQLMERCWEVHPAQKVPSPASGQPIWFQISYHHWCLLASLLMLTCLKPALPSNRYWNIFPQTQLKNLSFYTCPPLPRPFTSTTEVTEGMAR